MLLFTIENPSLNPPFFKIVPPGIWEKKEKYLPLEKTPKRGARKLRAVIGII